MLSAQEFGQIVGWIYDSSLDPERWSPTLERITQALHFHNASLSLLDLRSGAFPLSITSGIEEPWLGLMARYDEAIINQWGGMETLASYPLDEPLVLTWINPAASSDDNPYYTEWSKPQGLIDLVGIGLARDSLMFGALGLGRHETAGPVRQADIEDIRLLVPHLQRAIAISRLLDLRQITASSFETILKRLSTPVFVLSAGRQILWSNPAADDLLASTDMLANRTGQLWLAQRAAREAFTKVVSLLNEAEGAVTHGFDVPLHMEDGRLLSLYVIPLDRALAGSRIQSMAVMVGPCGQQRDACDIVGSLFELTPSEQRVLSCIARGATVKATAAHLAIGEATVRTHLLRIFDKTGVHRQPELIALVSSFAIPVRPDAEGN